MKSTVGFNVRNQFLNALMKIKKKNTNVIQTKFFNLWTI